MSLGHSKIISIYPSNPRSLPHPYPATNSLRTPITQLTKQHGHLEQFRFCLCRGFRVRYIIWCDNTPGTYVYYLRDSGDALTIKLLVAAVWILDTLHILFLCHALYYYLITNYGVPMSFEYIIWSFPASTLVNIPLVVAVQCFFAHQIYHLCRPRVKLWVTAPIACQSSDQRCYADDVLWRDTRCHRRRSGSALSRTKRLLNTLIIYAVNRCLLILLIAITALVMTMEGQDTWFLGFSFVAGRLYANAFLASLNCRERLRSQGSASGGRRKFQGWNKAGGMLLILPNMLLPIGLRSCGAREKCNSSSYILCYPFVFSLRHTMM
ncbi:hypothetical protein EDD17DRAFT_1072921 [Pisolithus thermaeus]|nr:hypothetical protein EDD17DRAFT_1072921 [Pisolithus thermaeus]